jgi:glycosyltransferase 2 family protein
LAKNRSAGKQWVKLLKPLLQLLVTLIALSLVLAKTDTGKLAALIGNANPWYLLLAIVFFNVSKLFNAIRLNRFFRLIGIELSFVYNIKLYYLGMFYNLFLPGGIGGDGYKIYVLQKNHGLKIIDVFNAVFWDRVCGIIALVFLSVILLLPSSFALKFPGLVPYAWLLLIALYPLSFILNRIFYRQFLKVFARVTVESLLVQATQVISAFFILIALTRNGHSIDYLAIFLISTVATILPITIGGAGAREVTFYYLLNSIHLETGTGIALSMIFFAISAVSSLPGILSRIRHEKSPAVAGAEEH